MSLDEQYRLLREYLFATLKQSQLNQDDMKYYAENAQRLHSLKHLCQKSVLIEAHSSPEDKCHFCGKLWLHHRHLLNPQAYQALKDILSNLTNPQSATPYLNAKELYAIGGIEAFSQQYELNTLTENELAVYISESDIVGESDKTMAAEGLNQSL